MSCDISKGKAILACKDNVGGLKAIYLANYDDYGFTINAGSTAGNVLSGLGALGATGSEVYKYELKNTGNTFTEEITSNRDAGTTSFKQSLNFVTSKLSAEMHFQIKMMAWGRPIIFVESNSGLVFIMGMENGCEVTGKAEIQGALTGMNGYTMTATAEEKDSIYYLDSTSVTALKALVSTSNVA